MDLKKCDQKHHQRRENTHGGNKGSLGWRVTSERRNMWKVGGRRRVLGQKLKNRLPVVDGRKIRTGNNSGQNKKRPRRKKNFGWSTTFSKMGGIRNGLIEAATPFGGSKVGPFLRKRAGGKVKVKGYSPNATHHRVLPRTEIKVNIKNGTGEPPIVWEKPSFRRFSVRTGK